MLEENLSALDDTFSARDAADVDNGSFRNDQAARRELLEAVESKLNSYDRLLHRYLQIKSRPDAPKVNVRNIRTWLSNRRGPIHENEVRFLSEKDLITAARGEKSPLRRLFEQHILAPTLGLFGSTTSRPDEYPQESGLKTTTISGEDRHVDIGATVSIFVAAVAMLIAPLWILAPLLSVRCT